MLTIHAILFQIREAMCKNVIVYSLTYLLCTGANSTNMWWRISLTRLRYRMNRVPSLPGHEFSRTSRVLGHHFKTNYSENCGVLLFQLWLKRPSQVHFKGISIFLFTYSVMFYTSLKIMILFWLLYLGYIYLPTYF